MKKKSSVLKLIQFNFKTLVKFELFFKLLIGILFMPLALIGFNFTMKISGYTYITLENVSGFLLNPFTILLLFLNILFLTIVTLFDTSTLIIIFDASYQKKKIRVLEAMRLSLEKCKKICKLKNISAIFFVMFLIPFFNFGISSNVISSIKIPEFIMDYIANNGTLLFLFMILYFFLSTILVKWFYALHYMVLEDKSFKKARTCSSNMIKNHKLKDYFKIALTQIAIAFFYLLFIIFGIVVIILFHSLLENKILESVAITIIWVFIVFSFLIFANLSNGINYAIMSNLFYKHKIEKKEKIEVLDYNCIVEQKKKIKWFPLVVIGLILLASSSVTYQVITGNINFNVEWTRKIELTAHRGASVTYPENTMAAFVGAKELGADWIELDVQQTKDKKIVVIHDTNLKRITGVNAEVIDMTYEEIRKLDAGSFFDKKFSSEKIPSLEEVLEFAKKNDIKLNIELKPTGKEQDFERQVITLIKKHHMEKRCVVTSQVYQVLENIKEIDSDIKTVYVMSIAIGNITELKKADAYSVEASNVNTTLVNKVHKEGKELYAWTVNTEESIQKMIDLNVDNIITDNIELGEKLIIQSKTSNFLNEFLKLLNDET